MMIKYLKKIKFDYPKNEKNFWSETKIIFRFSQKLSFNSPLDKTDKQIFVASITFTV